MVTDNPCTMAFSDANDDTATCTVPIPSGYTMILDWIAVAATPAALTTQCRFTFNAESGTCVVAVPMTASVFTCNKIDFSPLGLKIKPSSATSWILTSQMVTNANAPNAGTHYHVVTVGYRYVAS